MKAHIIPFLLLAGISSLVMAHGNDKEHATCQKHLYHLHGAIIESKGVKPTHPKFGVYDFMAIVSALSANKSIQLTADIRPEGTNVLEYAEKMADEINQLIASGVAAGDITVNGFSKGSAIAMNVSRILQNPDINYVFMAMCNRRFLDREDFTVSGRVLSIYEKSDRIGNSCQSLVDRSPNVSEFKEIELDTGKMHGAFYTADEQWIKPVIEWALHHE